jgi:hypothetical protein
MVHYYTTTEQVDSNGNTSDFYSGGARFECWPGHRQPRLTVFALSLIPFRKMPA